MEWISYWKKKPSKDGLYLCEIEGHYGLFSFSEGKFHTNDWFDHTGVTFESHYIGCENDIIHWMELPKFKELSLFDIDELKSLRKEREKLERKRKRQEKKSIDTLC